VSKLASLKRDLEATLIQMKSIDPDFTNDKSINQEIWDKLNNTINQINEIRNKRNFNVKKYYSKK
jgi:membrane-associated HD superfamily phosphohydrolase